MNEPAWIEHDGSAVCPVPAGHDVERQYEGGDTYRDNWPDRHDEWSVVTHYRDWTAFEQEQPKMSKDDLPENPPAFPSHAGDPEMTDPRNRISCGGMTLRDYVATAVLQGVGTWMPYNFAMGLNGREALDARAMWAYQQADAMLRARGVGVTATDGPRCAAKIGE